MGGVHAVLDRRGHFHCVLPKPGFAGHAQHWPTAAHEAVGVVADVDADHGVTADAAAERNGVKADLDDDSSDIWADSWVPLGG